MADERKVVWVLGAGFSAGLGGPLLQGLLSPSSENDIKVRYPDAALYPALHSIEADYVRALYQHGLGRDYMVHSHPWKGEQMWTHAEEFIDYLDTAAEKRDPGAPNPHAGRLEAIVRGRWKAAVAVEGLRNTARQLVAAECCAFLEGADARRSERWNPFRKWAYSLTPHDTIVTFNYDRVLELLRDAQNERAARLSTPGSSLHFVTPGHDDAPSAWSGSTPVFKLHGSVDWQKQDANGKVLVTVRDPLFALTCPAYELAIATPGPSKAREAAGFDALWTYAKAAFSEADVIVFVGFRFPETDADVRASLLGAIAKGPKEPHPRALELHVILGHPGPHTARLESLLQFAGRKRRNQGFNIRTHPLFAQDFFSVATREDL